MRTLLRLAPLLLTLFVACDTTAPAPVPSSIVLDRSSLVMDDGDTARISVTVLDQRGEPMDSLPASTPLVWTSSAPLVARVERGLVRGMGPGDAEIVATVGQAEATVAVQVKPVAVGFRPATNTSMMGTVAMPLEDSIGIRVYDRSNRRVPGIEVRFTVLTGGGTLSATTVPTGADGYARVAWVLGPVAGLQTVEARATGLQGRVEFVALASPGPAVEIRPYGGNGQAGTADAALPIAIEARVSDAHDNPIEERTVTWSVSAGGGSVSAASVTSDVNGIASTIWTLGPSGEQALSASVEGLAPALFTASLDGTATAPKIASVSPARLEPGTLATLSGEGFGSSVNAVRISVADVDAEVLAVAPGSIDFRVPGRDLLPCAQVTNVVVMATVDGSSGTALHPLDVALTHALAPGEAVTLSTQDEISCGRLPEQGDYVVTVASTASTIGGMVPLYLRAIGTGAAAAVAPSRPVSARVGAPLAQSSPVSDERHHAVIESSRRVLETHPIRRGSGAGPLFSQTGQSLPSVGDTLDFRIPDISSSDLCTGYFNARARVVYVGEHGIALEDLAAPLAGTMDDRIEAVAAEYDADMHPLLLEYFGDPLAVDTDGDGHLYMFFSERVNQAGSLGFVWGGNFAAAASCAGSNEAEVFYAAVPTTQEGGYGAETPENWSWIIRNVLVHEVKHLVSYAERIAAYTAGGALRLEELWLEESTARAAEEIWARTVYGYVQGGNTSHAQSIYCEVRPSWAECAGKPKVMINHFVGLYEWHRAGGSRTPLGRTVYGDHSYYGSGWSLVRWAADHSGTGEAAFFQGLVDGGPAGGALVGAANLEAGTGLAFAEMVESWGVAMAVDDFPGMVAENPLHTFPSWNLRDVFGGLNTDFPNSWTEAYPALIRPLPLDGSTVSFHQLAGGSAAYWGVVGGGSVVEIRGSDSVGLAPHVRVTIIRTR